MNKMFRGKQRERGRLFNKQIFDFVWTNAAQLFFK